MTDLGFALDVGLGPGLGFCEGIMVRVRVSVGVRDLGGMVRMLGGWESERSIAGRGAAPAPLDQKTAAERHQLEGYPASL